MSDVLNDAYNSGAQAFRAGLRLGSNPYTRDVKMANLWRKGWKDAWLDHARQETL